MQEHDHHHGHTHSHDIAEVINNARSPRLRSKLLVAGAANAVLAAGGVWAEQRTGAQPSLAEAFHNVGDVSFYIAPWLGMVGKKGGSERALRWVKKASYAVIALALTGTARDLGNVVQGTYEHPTFASVPAQVGLTIGNIAVAWYMTRKDVNGDDQQDTVHDVSARHAAVDAATSAGAIGFNAIASLAAPIVGPLGATVLNGITIRTEAANIKQAQQALTHKIH